MKYYTKEQVQKIIDEIGDRYELESEYIDEVFARNEIEGKQKLEYALEAIELANENHISINGFASIGGDFFEQLGKLVYDMASHRRKLDIYSFGENSTMKIPGKTTFIEINIS